MALSRRIARPLLASIFVVGGWDALVHPAGKAKKAEAVSEPLSESVGVDRVDAETLVRINGAVQVGAGVLLAVGKFRRLAALALIGSIIPTTYAGHRFWEESDPSYSGAAEGALPQESWPSRWAHSRGLRHRG